MLTTIFDFDFTFSNQNWFRVCPEDVTYGDEIFIKYIISNICINLIHRFEKEKSINHGLKDIMCVCAKSFQSCPILYDPMDCSPPVSSVHGIFQARLLEWVAIMVVFKYMGNGLLGVFV